MCLCVWNHTTSFVSVVKPDWSTKRLAWFESRVCEGTHFTRITIINIEHMQAVESIIKSQTLYLTSCVGVLFLQVLCVFHRLYLVKEVKSCWVTMPC